MDSSESPGSAAQQLVGPLGPTLLRGYDETDETDDSF